MNIPNPHKFELNVLLLVRGRIFVALSFQFVRYGIDLWSCVCNKQRTHRPENRVQRVPIAVIVHRPEGEICISAALGALLHLVVCRSIILAVCHGMNQIKLGDNLVVQLDLLHFRPYKSCTKF